MRLVIQRVKEASCLVKSGKGAADYFSSKIGRGLLILLGVENGDTLEDVLWLAYKTVNLRIFDDEQGVMNRSVLDIGGDVLAVSQFTLLASTRKGNRPSYIRSAPQPFSEPLYKEFCKRLSELLNRSVGEGKFGADMEISLINDGPVTIVIDSRLRE